MPILVSKVLLDKGVIRRAYEARVRLVHKRKLAPPHQEALDLLEHLNAAPCQVFITQESANLLRLRPPRYTGFIHAQASTLYKARYLRRWARRLREHNFTREDAVVLAYCSFGIDEYRRLPGIETLLTTDGKLRNNYQEEQAEIQTRFTRMVADLRAPYTDAKLPAVLTAAVVLALT